MLRGHPLFGSARSVPRIFSAATRASAFAPHPLASGKVDALNVSGCANGGFQGRKVGDRPARGDSLPEVQGQALLLTAVLTATGLTCGDISRDDRAGRRDGKG
jgi:hypothetical protein